MEVGVGATDLDQHVPPAVGDSSQARLVRTGCRSHEQGLRLGRRRRLDDFLPLDFCCARLAMSPALWSARASAASSAMALWPCPVQQIVQRELSERSVRKACMALGCIALKARQGLALHRTSIAGQRLRCCRVAELENSPNAGRESLVACGSSEALVPSVA